MRKLTILAAFLLAGCAVQQTSEVAQPKGSALRAGPGDTIITINQRKSLPNAFGRADVFGRTTPTGMVTVQFLGADGTRAKFVRSGIAIETGATTMNSTPLILPNYQTTTLRGAVGSTPVTATATTVGPPHIIQPRRSQAQTMQQPTVAFEVDLRQARGFVVAGTTVRIISASPVELVYELQ